MMREVFARIDSLKDKLTTRTREIAEIPSPTFHETTRTEYLMGAFPAAGLKDVVKLPKGSVLGFTQAKGRPDTLLLASHIDTVFALETDLATRVEGSRVYGPGTGDNAAGLANIITLAEILRDLNIVPERNLAFCGNVCEEGVGNLAGIAEVLEDMGGTLGAVLAVDGTMPNVLIRSLAVRRFALSAVGPGGHAWADFGRPSAVHEMARIVAEVSRIDVPAEPKTSFNVGTIKGGSGINAIAQECASRIELRSLETESLEKLERQFLGIVDGVRASGVEIKTKVIGERPASALPPESELARTVLDAAKWVGLKPEVGAASTDAALPSSRGIPALAMGTCRGGGVHTLEEYIEPESLPTGLKWLALAVLKLAKAVPGCD
jgi:acetylornithine deacetylase/succinyl-diaminopimelate desuccinylase-like protein